MRDATRVISVVEGIIDRKTKSGAGIEVTYGQVEAVVGREASVFLAGSRELAISDGGTPEASTGFRIPAHLSVAADDYVRVSVDSRGHRWIEEVIQTTAYPRFSIDVERGLLLLGSGASAPVTGGSGQFVKMNVGGTALEFGSAPAPSISAGGGFTIPSGDLTVSAGDLLLPNAGDIRWGTDLRVVRTQAGRMVIDGNGASAATEIGITAVAGQRAKFDARVGSDTFPRFELFGDATMQGVQFGSGTATPDTNLYRSGTNALKTDDSLEVVGNLAVAGLVNFIQTGTASVTITAAASGDQSVSFSPAFAGTPRVVASVAQNTALYFCSVNTISASGFSVKAVHRDGNSTSTTVTVNWIAIYGQG